MTLLYSSFSVVRKHTLNLPSSSPLLPWKKVIPHAKIRGIFNHLSSLLDGKEKHSQPNSCYVRPTFPPRKTLSLESTHHYKRKSNLNQNISQLQTILPGTWFHGLYTWRDPFCCDFIPLKNLIRVISIPETSYLQVLIATTKQRTEEQEENPKPR